MYKEEKSLGLGRINNIAVPRAATSFPEHRAELVSTRSVKAESTGV